MATSQFTDSSGVILTPIPGRPHRLELTSRAVRVAFPASEQFVGCLAFVLEVGQDTDFVEKTVGSSRFELRTCRGVTVLTILGSDGFGTHLRLETPAEREQVADLLRSVRFRLAVDDDEALAS